MNKQNWQTLTESGIALLRQGQAQKALGRLKQAQQLAPNDRAVRYWLANAYRATGEISRAKSMLRRLLIEKNGDFDPSFALAFLLRDDGSPDIAADVLLIASEQPAITVNQLLQIAGFLRDSNQYAAAIQVCEKAASLNPGQADLQFKLARLYQATGAFDQALDHLRKTLDLKPSTGPAWTTLAQQRRFESADDAEFRRIQAATGQSYGNEADMCIAFAYGKALDDLQQWPQAWAQYQKGNDLKSLTTRWNRSAWMRLLERSLASSPKMPPAESGAGRNAVFIVGMPRSGTTLLEQMLDRHGGVTGRGELNFLDHFVQQRSDSDSMTEPERKEMANMFWAQLRLNGPESGVYIDKNPLNFRHLDVLFEIMPTARVVHVTRDGRDSCLSCYFQPFQHADAAFSDNLEHLVEFYAGYRRLMTHWENIYGQRIYRVNYDELVQSSDEVLAGVFRFLGKEMDDVIAPAAIQDGVVRSASAWQARQPVHTRSVARWRHYHDQAPEFFDQLSIIDSNHDGSIPATNTLM